MHERATWTFLGETEADCSAVDRLSRLVCDFYQQTPSGLLACGVDRALTLENTYVEE